MKRSTQDDGTVRCTNRLLLMIFISIAIQTIIYIGIGIGLFVVYDTHRHDINQLGSVPWGDMARDIKTTYLNMDKNAINDILTNSKNLTQKANLLIHTRGDPMLNKIDTVVAKAVRNTDLLDTAREIMYDTKKPLKEIVQLIDHSMTIDVKQIKYYLLQITKEMETIKVNKMIASISKIFKQVEASMTKENMDELTSFLHKFNHLLSQENTKLVHDLAEDADHSVQSINRLFKLFDTVKQSSV